eukprot:XP_001949868.4 PREDICTED: UDP-glucuronosyltransferase 1-5-like [Acyrthosiphon pisum]
MASRFGALLITFSVFQALLSPQPMAGAANILAVQTIAAKSHWNVMQAVLRSLTDRGHSVTAFTPFADGDRDGYTEVDISGYLEAKVGLNVSRYTGSTRSFIAYLMNALRVNCGTIFEHQRMQDILEGRSPPFDAVIAEGFWSDCVSYAATVLRVPAIYVVPSPIVTHVERSFFGHVPNPAAVSNLLSPSGVPKTFGQRFTNTLRTVSGSWLVWDNERRLRQSDPRPFDAMDLVRPSLTFTNTHFITEPSRPLTPDIVQIGGIHLTPPGPVPKSISVLYNIYDTLSRSPVDCSGAEPY